MTSPAGLLAARVRGNGARPLLTWYDDSTGERVELSAVSLANWAAKTAFLLADDLDVEPGERVGVRLPAHWQTAAVLLGVWSVGAVVDLTGGPTRVQVVHAPLAGDVSGGDHTVALGLLPMGGRAPGLPAGVLDYAVEVPGQPDVWAGPLPGGDDPVVAIRGGSAIRGSVGMLVSGAELERHALALADGPARVLARVELLDSGSVVDLLPWLALPLAGGGSTVLVRAEAAGGRAARVAAERVTHVVVRGDGGAELAPA